MDCVGTRPLREVAKLIPCNLLEVEKAKMNIVNLSEFVKRTGLEGLELDALSFIRGQQGSCARKNVDVVSVF